MSIARLILIVLDAFTPAIAERFMAGGHMPALARLKAQSARFALDHGPALHTGLFGEHVATGAGPELSGRQSAVTFDPRGYRVWQEGVNRPPFPAGLTARTVVADPTYFDLAQAPTVQGFTDWGAHDPGAPRLCRPEGLRAEIDARFGLYPAPDWIYASCWASAARTVRMRDALVKSLERRGEVTTWLLAERLPDWRLAIVTASELHSLSEGMWHGIDPSHPHHAHPSAPESSAAFAAVYGAFDRFIGRLAAAFPDAAKVMMCMHGMGPNQADIASMVLLPELLCRATFGSGLLKPRPEWTAAPNALPLLREDEEWETALGSAMLDAASPDLAHALAHVMRASADGLWPDDGATVLRSTLDWMPAARYRRLWPRMSAFALPAFLGGRVRINLTGREARGRVGRFGYGRACAMVERLLGECRDVRTGAPVVDSIERRAPADPTRLDASGEDLYIHWRGSPVGFDHPRLGRIGPIPYRRTGSHTGGHGIAYISGTPLTPGEHGVRSAFDVVPTIIDLLGERAARPTSGRSLLGPPQPARVVQAAAG